MKVLLCAGGRIDKTCSLKAIAPENSFKGHIRFSNKAMIQWILDVIAQVPMVTKVYVVGYEGPVLYCKGKEISHIKGGNNLVEKLVAGSLAVLKEDPNCDRLLWVSSDIPLIKPEMIEWFIAQISGSLHDIYYQIIPQTYMQSHSLGKDKTCVKLNGESVCFADVHAFNPKIVQQNLHLCKQLEKHRKSPFKIACYIGCTPLLRFMLRQITEKYVKNLFRKKLNLSLKFIHSLFPEMGLDVDNLEDYKAVSDSLKTSV